ncbi:DUF4956 domain-containing protein [Streptococcus sp.]|uniref:DUF4956 domain-containing protein n=1 Tax=Streptococcus sp. TaxID=1306 RepID=UPI0035A004EF
MTVSQIGLILATSLVLGVVLAMVYKYQTLHTKEFVITLTLMPALIAIIILLVNGNLGTSVAVAGAFSLIRFRSAAGSSKELLAVFLATAIGLATGMGYLLLAVAFTLILSLLIFLLEQSPFAKPSSKYRYLILTVPKEFDVDYFFQTKGKNLCQKHELVSLQYKKKKDVLVLESILEMNDQTSDKELMDKLLLAGPIDAIIHQQIPKKKRL